MIKRSGELHVEIRRKMDTLARELMIEPRRPGETNKELWERMLAAMSENNFDKNIIERLRKSYKIAKPAVQRPLTFWQALRKI